MHFKKSTAFLSLLLLLVLWSACKKDKSSEEDNTPVGIADEYYAGGSTTTFASGQNAFVQPLANLSASDIARHDQTREIFFHDFNASEGLGPLFIATSCANCHVNNGRGQYALSGHTGLLMRMSLPGANIHNGPLGVPEFGVQLQSSAIAGATPEGTMNITYEEVVVNFPDGHQVVLHQPYYSLIDEYTEAPAFFLKGGRLAPPVYGAGLIDAISDESLLLLADEFDSDGDGISGKVNWVWNVALQQHTIGKFGWKASNPSAIQQAADAFNQDMGITTFQFFPDENCDGQSNCSGTPTKGGDITEQTLEDVVFYFQTLAPPAPRNLENPEVQLGKHKFNELGCAKCHLPELTTDNHPIPELSNQVIRPYSDFLLHELGSGLGDGRPDYDANANEWRTPPLWGLGLAKVVYPDAGYLHDGRANTLEEAILWHEGEAFQSRQAYIQLPEAERLALIKFLEAL